MVNNIQLLEKIKLLRFCVIEVIHGRHLETVKDIWMARVYSDAKFHRIQSRFPVKSRKRPRADIETKRQEIKWDKAWFGLFGMRDKKICKYFTYPSNSNLISIIYLILSPTLDHFSHLMGRVQFSCLLFSVVPVFIHSIRS